MKQLVEAQIELEQRHWKESLEFMKRENAMLRIRLSKVLDDVDDEGFIATAEYFNNRFFINDLLIDKYLIRLKELNIKNPEVLSDMQSMRNIKNGQLDLRSTILRMEKLFFGLVNEFNAKIFQSLGV